MFLKNVIANYRIVIAGKDVVDIFTKKKVAKPKATKPPQGSVNVWIYEEFTDEENTKLKPDELAAFSVVLESDFKELAQTINDWCWGSAEVSQHGGELRALSLWDNAGNLVEDEFPEDEAIIHRKVVVKGDPKLLKKLKPLIRQ